MWEFDLNSACIGWAAGGLCVFLVLLAMGAFTAKTSPEDTQPFYDRCEDAGFTVPQCQFFHTGDKGIREKVK